MISVVMFDLGGTLVNSQGHPFDHAAAALDSITAMQAANGKRLLSCLVSDFTLASPPLTAAKIKPLFEQYLAMLEATGLRPYFEPVRKRVTLSTHVGQAKPARAVFQKALQRLGTNAGLAECLLITENAVHVVAVRTQLGMAALKFRMPGDSAFDFDDWRQAPALVAQRLEA